MREGKIKSNFQGYWVINKIGETYALITPYHVQSCTC